MGEFDLVAYFSNSNIDTYKEFELRRDSFIKLCENKGLNYHVDEYKPDDWLCSIKGLEAEPERGNRCFKCFYFRLKRTYDFAKNNNIGYITSTLTISPYKNSAMIFQVADNLSKEYDIEYLKYDFKKKDGFKKTMELAKKNKFYLQNYCACIFSNKNGR